MPSESLPSPPATAFRYYTENFAAATELCRVRGGKGEGKEEGKKRGREGVDGTHLVHS